MDDRVADAQLHSLADDLAQCLLREGRLRLLADSLPVLIAYLDVDQRYLFSNRTYSEWLGLDGDAIQGRTMAEILGAPAWEVLRPFMERALRGEVVRFDADVPYRTGNRRVEAVYVPEIDAAGRVRGVAALTQDVSALSEHKRAAAELRRSSELLERMFDSVHILIAYLDVEFNFLRVNSAYAASDGRPPEFFVGKNHFDLYPHAENERIFRRAVEVGESWTVFEKAFQYPDHPERGVTYWDWTVQPVKDPQNNVEGLVLILVDVTEKARARQRLEALVVELRRGASLMSRAEELGQLGYWEDDLATRQVRWSEGVFRLLGIGVGDSSFAYADFGRYVYAEEWPALRRSFDEAVAGEVVRTEREVRIRRADSGEERVLVLRGEVELDGAGKPGYLFWVLRDVTATKRQAQLEELAARDPLTGAANRRALERFMDRELRRESRHGHPIALIMIDVDAFKAYNDLYGHPQGDECLRQISRGVQARLRRPGDLLVRYGGEEFLVVLSETDLGAARQLAEELREAVAGMELLHAGSPAGGSVTISLGVAAARARLGGFEALLADADAALYRAKNHGRNRVETTPE